MQRKRFLVSMGLALGAVAILTGVGTPGQHPNRAVAAGGVVKSARIHPLLQVGAQVDPDKTVAVIVTKKDKKNSSADISKKGQVSHKRDFDEIGSFQAELTYKQLSKLAADGRVKYITPDAPVYTTAIDTSALETTYEQAIGVDKVWNSATAPATGKGVGVAVLDTGINRDHVAFASDKANVIEITTNPLALGTADGHGHGTHVAGTIKGKDALGRYIGVAPDVKLISVKIADATGAARESDLLTGLQWVYSNRTAYNIKVVNISFSASVATSYEASPINAYVEQLWFAGVTVVASSGNRGNVQNATWYAPGNDPYVITVGGFNHKQTISSTDDIIGTWSSRGHTQNGFAKPEIVAPGRRIVAPLASNSATLALQLPLQIVDTNYIRLTGTSMAAPIVAGTVALLLEKYPTLTPNQVKYLLTSTANNYPYQADSAGVVDIVGALQRAALGAVPSANIGFVPAHGVDPVTGIVSNAATYWDQTYWDQTFWDQSYSANSSTLDID